MNKQNGATTSAHREGPARARALARQRAAEGPESATAWLKGSHEAIVLHPQWQQVPPCEVLCACLCIAADDTGQHAPVVRLDCLLQKTKKRCRLALVPSSCVPTIQKNPWRIRDGVIGHLYCYLNM